MISLMNIIGLFKIKINEINVAFIKLIKSLFSHYFLYITIMNALGLLFCDPHIIQLFKDFSQKIE